MNEQMTTWSELVPDWQLDSLMQAAMQSTARGLSGMVERPIEIAPVKIGIIPVSALVAHAGNPGPETIGVRLLIQGELRGQALLMLPLSNALNLVDLLLSQPLGTTTGLDELARSALAEVGNVTVSYFLNSISTLIGKDLLPSPPIVMVNVLSIVLDKIAAAAATMTDRLQVFETVFRDSGKAVQARFWVLPAPLARTPVEYSSPKQLQPEPPPLVQEKRRICLIHGRAKARYVLTQALASKLNADTEAFSCCENALSSSMNYDVFVVYNNFGQKRMRGVTGVRRIRALKPDAFIMGVSVKPYGENRFLPAGANVFLLRAGNEIGEMIKLILQKDGLSSSAN